jgi:hypothetical protein
MPKKGSTKRADGSWHHALLRLSKWAGFLPPAAIVAPGVNVCKAKEGEKDERGRGVGG